MDQKKKEEMKKVLLMGFKQGALGRDSDGAHHKLADSYSKLFKNTNFNVYSDDHDLKYNGNYDVVCLKTAAFGEIINDLESLRNTFNLITKTQPNAKILVQSNHNKKTLGFGDKDYTLISPSTPIHQALIDAGLQFNPNH